MSLNYGPHWWLSQLQKAVLSSCCQTWRYHSQLESKINHFESGMLFVQAEVDAATRDVDGALGPGRDSKALPSSKMGLPATKPNPDDPPGQPDQESGGPDQDPVNVVGSNHLHRIRATSVSVSDESGPASSVPERAQLVYQVLGPSLNIGVTVIDLMVTGPYG